MAPLETEGPFQKYGARKMIGFYEAIDRGIEFAKRLAAPYDGDILSDALGGRSVDDCLLDSLVRLSVEKINLERELSATRTRAAKNGAIALLAFGLIAIEVVGAALYFLPK
jgi:hypothetical protein